MRKKYIELILGISAVFAIAVALFASNARPTSLIDNLPGFFYLEFPAYSDAILNLSSGYTTSVFLYFLIVFFPEHLRRKRVRENALKVYREFKRSVLGLILSASGKALTLDQIEELMEPDKFAEYFCHDETGSVGRWNEFLNGLDDFHVGQIVIELEILRDEMQFIVNNVDLDDADAYVYLKHLSTVSYSMSKTGSDYDDQKQWGRFLMELFAQWNMGEGKWKKDYISESIRKI